MKHQSTKKLLVFIITAMMFFGMPVLVNAQRCGWDMGGCRKGYICISGYCVKYHGHRLSYGASLATSFDPGSRSATISFSMEQAEKLSVKIFDMTGRLVKSLAEKVFEQGEHELKWGASGVNTGIYFVQLNAGTNSVTRKISVIN